MAYFQTTNTLWYFPLHLVFSLSPYSSDAFQPFKLCGFASSTHFSEIYRGNFHLNSSLLAQWCHTLSHFWYSGNSGFSSFVALPSHTGVCMTYTKFYSFNPLLILNLNARLLQHRVGEFNAINSFNQSSPDLYFTILKVQESIMKVSL